MEKADIRIEADAEHIRLLKALAHPIRLELLGIMSYKDMSATDFAEHRGEPISNFGYHFRVLRELGFIELARTQPGRGSDKYIYRRIKQIVFTDRDWLIMPDEVRQIVASTTLRDLIGRMTEAFQAGTMTARTNTHLSWRPLVLDEQGWKELTEILWITFKAVTRLEMRAAERMRESGEDGIGATVALAGFESPRCGWSGWDR
jgi:DNA-binding transcriptional ArsR family regulator